MGFTYRGGSASREVDALGGNYDVASWGMFTVLWKWGYGVEWVGCEGEATIEAVFSEWGVVIDVAVREGPGAGVVL